MKILAFFGKIFFEIKIKNFGVFLENIFLNKLKILAFFGKIFF